jgi:two-component system sensor histidine kinase CpxA
LTGSIRSLRTSARRLADGDLAVRVGAAVRKRQDEIGDLGRDFDFMAEKIELLVSVQRRLLRDMSHELRSPMARLRVALELARRQTGPEVSGILNRIERETQRLNDLIGALSTVARMDSGEIRSEKMSIDLIALVHEVVTDADFEAHNRGRRVKVLCSEDCTAVGTRELLRSAIENVVRNAIRYTADGTQVDITLTCEQHAAEARAVIRVRDHGPGVPDGALEDIFRPFYRIDDDRDRQTGGVGLGLSIAQQAMRLHGGTISAANAPGGGLLVELTLPATPGSIERDRLSEGQAIRNA